MICYKQDTLEAVVGRRTLEKLLSIKSSPPFPTHTDSRAPSPKGLISFAVVITDTGNLSCHKPSPYKITLSALPDRENSDLSTVLLYILLLFIVYFALYIYNMYILLSIYVMYRVFFFADPLLL